MCVCVCGYLYPADKSVRLSHLGSLGRRHGATSLALARASSGAAEPAPPPRGAQAAGPSGRPTCLRGSWCRAEGDPSSRGRFCSLRATAPRPLLPATRSGKAKTSLCLCSSLASASSPLPPVAPSGLGSVATHRGVRVPHEHRRHLPFPERQRPPQHRVHGGHVPQRGRKVLHVAHVQVGVVAEQRTQHAPPPARVRVQPHFPPRVMPPHLRSSRQVLLPTALSRTVFT